MSANPALPAPTRTDFKHSTALTAVLATMAEQGEAPTDIEIPALVVTEAEAAKMLRLSTRTMQRLRLEGGGPQFIKLTDRRVGYTIGDIQTWLRSRSVANTSQTLGATR